MTQKKQNQIATGIVLTIAAVALGYYTGIFNWVPSNPLPDVVVIKLK